MQLVLNLVNYHPYSYRSASKETDGRVPWSTIKNWIHKDYTKWWQIPKAGADFKNGTVITARIMGYTKQKAALHKGLSDNRIRSLIYPKRELILACLNFFFICAIAHFLHLKPMKHWIQQRKRNKKILIFYWMTLWTHMKLFFLLWTLQTKEIFRTTLKTFLALFDLVSFFFAFLVFKISWYFYSMQNLHKSWQFRNVKATATTNAR